MLSLKRLPWIHLTAVLIEYILAAWLLSDCNAPWISWFGTQALTLHLAWVGTDAVALAVAWIICLVWGGAFSIAWPKSIPWAGFSVWAVFLALTWILALGLILTLAKAERTMKFGGMNNTQSFLILVIITWVGLGLGRIFNGGLS
jgi:hypothetical protein